MRWTVTLFPRIPSRWKTHFLGATAVFSRKSLYQRFVALNPQRTPMVAFAYCLCRVGNSMCAFASQCCGLAAVTYLTAAVTAEFYTKASVINKATYFTTVSATNSLCASAATIALLLLRLICCCRSCYFCYNVVLFLSLLLLLRFEHFTFTASDRVVFSRSTHLEVSFSQTA